MQIKEVIFISVDQAINDLEWKLPVIQEFKNSGYEINVQLFSRSRHDPVVFSIHLLQNMGVTIHFKEDLDPFEPLPIWLINKFRTLQNLGKLGSFLSKLYFSWNSWLPHNLYRHRIYSKNLLKLYNSSELIFLCHYPNIKMSGLINIIYESASCSNAFLIGIPLAPYNRWYHQSIYPKFDLVILNTKEEKNECSKITKLLIDYAGVPQFDSDWNIYCSMLYEKWSKKIQPYPDNKRKALVILTSEKHIQWKGMDHYSITLDMLKQLSDQNIFLLIKPHPRQDLDILNKILKEIPKSNFQLVDGLISYWAYRVDYVVSGLSMGCLLSLPAGKIPYVYWPINNTYKELLDDGKIPEIKEILLKKCEDGYYRFYLDEFVISITNNQLLIDEMKDEIREKYLKLFYNTFNPRGAACRIRKLIEKEISFN